MVQVLGDYAHVSYTHVYLGDNVSFICPLKIIIIDKSLHSNTYESIRGKTNPRDL